jgi:tRNA A58 N-methylase Trm61
LQFVCVCRAFVDKALELGQRIDKLVVYFLARWFVIETIDKSMKQKSNQLFFTPIETIDESMK